MVRPAQATRAAQALEPGAPAGATPPPDPRLIQDKQGSLPFLIALQVSPVGMLGMEQVKCSGLACLCIAWSV